MQTLKQLVQLVRWAHAHDLPYFVLGGGSNLLISDAGIRGLVLHNRCRSVRVEEVEPGVERQRELWRLRAESGAAMAGAARTAINAGLAGLEWAVSVPGTIGGAVVGNAGAHDGEIKDTLESVQIVDERAQERELQVAELEYGYRDSSLKRLRPLQAGFKPVVLAATFRLTPGVSAVLKTRAEAYLAHRRSTQPVEPSLGSTFVNPPGDFAGRLIEAAGLKGISEGGIEVSRTHANFLINPGGAGTGSAGAVMTLVERIQETVLAKFGIRLELEVQLAGEW